MQKLICAALLAGCTTVLTFGPTTPASACEIDPNWAPAPLTERAAESKLVALVTVVAQHEPIGSHTFTYDVDFTEIWTGEPLPRTTLVTYGTSCGFLQFDPGDEVAIMASDISDEYSISFETVATADELRAAIGPGTTAEGSPELFERVNTHPSPLLDPIGMVSSAIGQTISALRALLWLG